MTDQFHYSIIRIMPKLRFLFPILFLLEQSTTLIHDAKREICSHQFLPPIEPSKGNVRLFLSEQQIVQQWSCEEEFGSNRYALLVRNCEAKSRHRESALLVDQFGCPFGVGGRFLLEFNNTVRENTEAPPPVGLVARSPPFSFPRGTTFRISCTLSLVPKRGGDAEVKMPDCSENSTVQERFRQLTQILKATMNHKNRFIDLVETTVSSIWIRIVGTPNVKSEPTAPVQGLQWDQTPFVSEDEHDGMDEPEVTMNSFLEQAFSVPPTNEEDPFPAASPPPQGPTTSAELILFSRQLPAHEVDLQPDGEHRIPAPKTIFANFEADQHQNIFSGVDVKFVNRQKNNEGANRPGNKSSQKHNATAAFSQSFTAPTQHCSWVMLNTGLLVWSILATFHWLWLFGGKLRRFVGRLYISPKQTAADLRGVRVMRIQAQKWHKGGLLSANSSTSSSGQKPTAKKKTSNGNSSTRRRHLLHRTVISIPAKGSPTMRRQMSQNNRKRSRKLANPNKLAEEAVSPADRGRGKCLQQNGKEGSSSEECLSSSSSPNCESGRNARVKKFITQKRSLKFF